MIITLIIVGSVVFYAFVAGVLANVLKSSREIRCKKCRSDNHCYDDHEMTEFICSMFWPVVLPTFIGGYVASWWTGRGERADERRKKERAEYEKARDIIREAGIDWPDADWSVTK